MTTFTFRSLQVVISRASISSLAALLAAVDVSAHDGQVHTVAAKPLAADYTIYSGQLGNEQPPLKHDRKLSIEIKGEAARELFEAISPDVRGVSCSEERGARLRKKGRFWCAFSPSAGYKCFLGLDLKTGEGIAGGSC